VGLQRAGQKTKVVREILGLWLRIL
jgi:hypothetical protein